jgi:hypothetical protein
MMARNYAVLVVLVSFCVAWTSPGTAQNRARSNATNPLITNALKCDDNSVKTNPKPHFCYPKSCSSDGSSVCNGWGRCCSPNEATLVEECKLSWITMHQNLHCVSQTR